MDDLFSLNNPRDPLNPPEPLVDMSDVEDMRHEPPFLPVPKAPFYWIAKSALQKNIRGSRGRDALRAAAVVWQFDKTSLRRRLMVIAMEDVGMGDWPRAIWALNTLKRGRMKWSDYARVVMVLADANKNRDTDDGFNLVIWARGTNGEFGTRSPERVFQYPDTDEFRFLVEHSEHTPTPTGPGLALPLFWERFADKFERLGTDFQRLAKMMAGWGETAGWHACHFGVLTASRWRGGLPAPERVFFDTWDDPPMMPGSLCTLAAFDGHTLQGKRAQAKAARRFGISAQEAHFLSFFLEGARLHKRAAYANDYREIVVSAMWPEGLPDFTTDFMQFMNTERLSMWDREFAPFLVAPKT